MQGGRQLALRFRRPAQLPTAPPPCALAGLIRPDWPLAFPNNSVVVESLCSIVMRKGNPKNIRGWEDLSACCLGGEGVGRGGPWAAGRTARRQQAGREARGAHGRAATVYGRPCAPQPAVPDPPTPAPPPPCAPARAACDDVAVVTANPKTAGVARWIFLGLWGVRMGKGKKAATEYVTKVFDQVVVQPRDAREASDVFYRQVRRRTRGAGRRRGMRRLRPVARARSAAGVSVACSPRAAHTSPLHSYPLYPQGMGDVLLTYENEAFFTNQVVPEKARLPYITPDNNIRVHGVACGAWRGVCGALQAAGLPPSLPPLLRRAPPPARSLAPAAPPPRVGQIQCPLALIDHNLRDQAPEVREAATAFCNYLYTKEAQREFAACGFRCAGARRRGTWERAAGADAGAHMASLPLMLAGHGAATDLSLAPSYPHTSSLHPHAHTHTRPRRTPYKELSEELGLGPVKGLWTAEKRLGSWKQIQTEFFDDMVSGGGGAGGTHTHACMHGAGARPGSSPDEQMGVAPAVIHSVAVGSATAGRRKSRPSQQGPNTPPTPPQPPCATPAGHLH